MIDTREPQDVAPESPRYIYHLAKNIAISEGFSWAKLEDGATLCFFGIFEKAGMQELVTVSYNYNPSHESQKEMIKIMGPYGITEISPNGESYNSNSRIPNGLGSMLVGLKPDLGKMDAAVKALKQDSDARGKTLVYSR